MQFVPVNEPLLEGNERKYLNECIDTSWISSEGSFVTRLEEGMADRMDRKFGIAVSNGTAALEAAVAALDLGPGDEVILPAFTIISCASAIVRAGATPVLVDCDPKTWNLDCEQIECRLSERTKAIMAVHIYGLPVDMDSVRGIARKKGLRVIEDAAEAHGQTYRGKSCGSFGDISTLSFYPNKHVTTGEGGMILTDDAALAERCRDLRNLCFGKVDRFIHEELGWNFRMSNLQAAVGVAQLERLDEFVRKKRTMGRRYSEALSSLEGLQLPLPNTDYAENIYWVYGVVLRDEVAFDAREAMLRLSKVGVGTRPFFWPMHEQPVFCKRGLFNEISCPISERIARRGFYIPSGLALTESQMDRVIEEMTQFLS